MRPARIALFAGLALVAVAIGVTVLQAPMIVAGTNKSRGRVDQTIASTVSDASYCQAHEVLPRGTSAVRIWLDAAAGPRMSVAVSSAGRAITGGVRGSDWTGSSVTVPLKPLSRTVSDATVCASFRLRDETIVAQGYVTPAANAARDGRHALPGRIWIEYLRPGTRSWASMSLGIARRMGLGRAAAGRWIVLLAVALLATVVALASGLVVRELT